MKNIICFSFCLLISYSVHSQERPITALTIGETIESLPTDGDTFRVIEIDNEMATGRTAGHRTTKLKSGKVLITGDTGDSGPAVGIYDPVTQTFRLVASMSAGRCCHTATLLPDGRVLVTGGLERPVKGGVRDHVLASAEIYNPVTNQWSSVKDMNEARSGHFLIPLPNGRLLVVGGWNQTGPLASAEIFDPATLTFTETGFMKAPRASHVAIGLADGRVLITGGRSESGGLPLRSAEIYDPATGKFHPTGDMNVPRLKHAAALLPDGKVLIIGGIDGSNTANFGGRYKSTEIYDPETGTFSPGPDMRWPRFKIRDAVAVLPSGKVVVGGGFARLEVYDPAEEVFITVKGELKSEQEHRMRLHAFHTATSLTTDEVLIIGLSSAWIVRSAN